MGFPEAIYPIEAVPYATGAAYQGGTVTATNNGYARFSNLSAARNIFSATTSAGDKGNALFPPPSGAVIAVGAQPVRWRYGVDPTSSEGVLLPVGTIWVIENQPVLLQDLRFIETTASAEITILYFYTH
jgi:hypothetical protein